MSPIIEQYRSTPIEIPKKIRDLKNRAYRKTIRPNSLSTEPLVNLSDFWVPNHSFEFEKYGRHEFIRQDVYVRKTVAEKLVKINDQLSTEDHNLYVRCGFRHPVIQELQFSSAKKLRGEKFARSMLASKEDLAGKDSLYPHSTGGVVDVEIWCGGKRIVMGEPGVPMGTFDLEILFKKPNFSEKWRVYLENRRLLFHLMQEQGFYFILGEFWHWGMGDHLSGVATYLLGEKDYRPWYGLAEFPDEG